MRLSTRETAQVLFVAVIILAVLGWWLMADRLFDLIPALRAFLS